MFPIQLRARTQGEEKLGRVGVFARVSHAEDPGPCVLQSQPSLFVFELFAPKHGFPAAAVAKHKVAPLDHKPRFNTVHVASPVAQRFPALPVCWLLPFAQAQKVLARQRSFRGKQLDHDAAAWSWRASGDGAFVRPIVVYGVHVRKSAQFGAAESSQVFAVVQNNKEEGLSVSELGEPDES